MPQAYEYDVDFDPIDRIWTDRPHSPLTRFLSTMKKYAGESTVSKMAHHK